MRVSVEGNIGSGKSTALQHVGAMKDVPLFPEPMAEWGDLFYRFYEDPARWALPFSLRVLHGLRKPLAVPTSVVERSPLACRHVFGQLLFNDGKMTPDEWVVFKEYHDILGWAPDVIVYVATPVDVCLKRIQDRGNFAERNLTLEALKRLEFQYETMLRYCNVPVVRVDGRKSPEDIARVIVAVLEQA